MIIILKTKPPISEKIIAKLKRKVFLLKINNKFFEKKYFLIDKK